MDIACFQHMRILHLLHFTKMHKRPLGVFAELQNANPLLPFCAAYCDGSHRNRPLCPCLCRTGNALSFVRHPPGQTCRETRIKPLTTLILILRNNPKMVICQLRPSGRQRGAGSRRSRPIRHIGCYAPPLSPRNCRPCGNAHPRASALESDSSRR